MIEVLLVLLVILQVLDIYTTNNILKLGGRELNPVLVKFFELIGVMPGLLLAKAIFIGILAYFYIVSQQNLQVMFTPLVLLFIVYVIVVGNNFKVLKALKSRPTNQPQ